MGIEAAILIVFVDKIMETLIDVSFWPQYQVCSFIFFVYKVSHGIKK